MMRSLQLPAVCSQRFSDFSARFLMDTSVALSLPPKPLVVSALS